MTGFDQLGLGEEILRGIADLGYKDPFPIQEAVIPVLATGRDVIGQAHTGSGKTAAFALSMLQQIRPKQGIQGLILAPTRELAMQITDEIKKFSRYLEVRVATIYGGQGMGVQLDALDAGVEIVVATPGRLIDHLKRGSIELRDITYVVLDEADTMLDMGFIDDIQFILDLAPEERVMSLFSATMPAEILRLSEEYLHNPKQFLLDADDLSGEGIDQSFLVIRDRDKSKHMMDFIKDTKGQCIVFCSTKYRTRDVAKFLHQEKFDAVAIEGDMSQHRREQSMAKFRGGKADILVATDVASRGIDVPRVELVLNYDVPNQELAYFHRIGRTARAGAKGRAITMVSYSSIGDWNIIKKQIKVPLTDLNAEMNIKVSIPDPLKRQVGSRGFGGGRGPGRRPGGFGHGSGRGRPGGFGGRDRGPGRGGDRRPGGFGDRGRDRGPGGFGGRGGGRSGDRSSGRGRPGGFGDRGPGRGGDRDFGGRGGSGRGDRGSFGDRGGPGRGGDRGSFGDRGSGRGDRGSFGDRGPGRGGDRGGEKRSRGSRNSYGGRSRW